MSYEKALKGEIKMDKFFEKNGSEYITSLINDAVLNKNNSITVTGNYEIDTAIRLPSNFTLILDSCHLKMADGSYANMFVNEHNDTEIGRTTQGTDKNISIIGRGEVILDGGNYNNLSEGTANKNGLPPIWKNNLLLFTNVDGFEIKNVAFHNQRWWALNFIFCSNGHISDIRFKSNDTCIDKDGNVYHGVSLDRYDEILVKNADGIDIRQGCHDITIENISGFCEDDTVAITALDGDMIEYFKVPELCVDVWNITIKNVIAEGLCSNVRILNQGGSAKVHDILIDNIVDTSMHSPYMDRSYYGVRVGDGNHIYGERRSNTDEVYNITINNVVSRAICALHLAGGIGNLIFNNIKAFGDAALIEDYRFVEIPEKW